MLTNPIHIKSAYFPYPTDFCPILLFLKKSLNKKLESAKKLYVLKMIELVISNCANNILNFNFIYPYPIYSFFHISLKM